LPLAPPDSDPLPPDEPLDRLRRLVARLRGPDGCPWDREQTLADLRAYLIEEVHEAAAAIDDDDPPALGEELGDVLFLVVFAAELLRERGGAGIAELARAAEAKMISRHPHVFGNEQAHDAAAVRKVWGRRKRSERAASEGEQGAGSALDGVPATLPTLLQAYRMTQKAADLGFDWPEVEGVLAKVEEELGEVREAIAAPPEPRRDRLQAELGDLLFTVANLARHLEIDPDAALAGANRRFRDRFGRMESSLAGESRGMDHLSLDELDGLWEQAKSGD
jgi:MazG family protein